jgi:tetratricopeptide (TPR) repeat protein
VRDADADYPGLAGALAATYLHLGRAELENGAPAAAIALFDAVLAHEPYNQVAAEQRDLALAYLEGEAALDAGNWPLAATKLQEVHDLAPDYLEGTGRGGVKEKLYAARLRWGQALLEQRVYAAAASFCAQAAMLVPTGAEAVACRDAAGAALAPAPTEGG